MRKSDLRLAIAGLFFLLLTSLGLAQSTVLQGGAFTPSHLSQYAPNNFSSQPIISDTGGAGGGPVGTNPSELGITAQGSGSPPYAGQGTGPNGENICDYDGPTTSAAGYHALCFSANASGGGLISYNAFGAASQLPLLFQINGAITGIVLGPGTSTNGDFACWNGATGSLLSDCGSTIPIGKGGTGQITANAALNALLPSQTGNSGKVLQTDGSTTSWQSGGGGGSGTVTSIIAGAGLSGGTITTSGTIAINNAISAGGPTGSATTVPVITYNAQGLLTAVSSANITGTAPGGSAGGDLSGSYPNPTVAKVNGVAYGSGPSTNTVPVVTGANTVTYETVPNAALANAATTVNGQTCTLGSTCTISASAGTITVGTTTIAGSTTGHVLYNNAGTLGDIATTGSGSVVLATAPTMSSATVTSAFTATGLVTNADLANSSMTLAGHSVSLGGTQTFACADLSNGATGCSTATGTSGATIPLLNAANTWSGVQSFNSSDLVLNGSGSGATTLNSGAAAGASVLTLPVATDTLVGKATTDTLTNKTLTSPALGGTVTGNNTIPLTILSQSGANTMLGNWTAGTANVVANAMPSCADTAGNHLNYVSGTGITCGTTSSKAGTVTSIATTSPITGGTITATGTIACATCVTSSGGGAITGTAPVAVSAAGVVSITGAAGQVLAGASPAFTATPTLGVPTSTLGTLTLAGSTSGSTTIQPNVTASGTLTLPAATDTLVGKATTDNFTNKTYNTSSTGNAFSINGNSITLVSGTGTTVALTAGPTFTTPTLGVANATTVNKVTLTAPATGSTLTIADGKTLTANNSLTLAGTDSTTQTFPTVSSSVGGQTLVATLTTTSGTTQTTGTLPTSCNQFLIFISGVSANADANALDVELSSNGGSTFPGSMLPLGAAQLGAAALYGQAYIDLITGAGPQVVIPASIESGTGGKTTNPVFEGSVTGPINALRFVWSAGASFDAGTITVYCVR